MATANYEVVFNGMLVRGFEPDQVKQNLAKLFKTDVSKIESLFSGSMVVIKAGLDKEAATKYQTAMKNAGAVCAIREKASANVTEKPSTPAAPVAQQKTTSTNEAAVSESTSPVSGSSADNDMLAPPGVQLVEHEVVPEPDIDISSISMAEVGADVTDPVPVPSSPEYNLDGLDMAEVGADVTDPVEPPSPPEFNLDGLDMAEVGADVADPVAPPPPFNVSIDGLSMAEVGADVTDPTAPVPEPAIDISKLKFAE